MRLHIRFRRNGSGRHKLKKFWRRKYGKHIRCDDDESDENIQISRITLSDNKEEKVFIDHNEFTDELPPSYDQANPCVNSSNTSSDTGGEAEVRGRTREIQYKSKLCSFLQQQQQLHRRETKSNAGIMIKVGSEINNPLISQRIMNQISSNNQFNYRLGKIISLIKLLCFIYLIFVILIHFSIQSRHIIE